MKKFVIKTLGCKTNQIESAMIAEILSDAGFIETDVLTDADFYILNSCSVTHIADKKNLAYLKRAKKENPNIKTILTGCMAQLQKDNLIKSKISDFVIGNNEKNKIADLINNNEHYAVNDIFLQDKFNYKQIHNPQRTRASVKIQDGCNNRCTYCTIPFARGKNRSNSINNIIEQINIYSEENFKEIVLTGIHIGQWGLDFNNNSSLINLLEEIEKTNITRYRLGSLNPSEINNDLLNFLAKSQKFCPHFHLSLQSVCNKTLKNMNRFYTETQIKEVIDKINQKFPLAFIGCDIITGFPDESQEDFDITYNNLLKLNLSRMHVFPYSRRKGTIADTLPNQIPETIKQARAESLQKLSLKKHTEFLNSNINTQNEVIIESKRDKKTNLLKGTTKNYINVLINAEDDLKESIQNILITGFSEDKTKLIAEIYPNS